MKSNFVIAMTVLMIFTISGSIIGYNSAVHKITAHKQHAEHSKDHHVISNSHEVAKTETTNSTTETNTESDSQQPPVLENENNNNEIETTETTTKQNEIADVAMGEKIYNTSCSGCHGADASGGVGPNLKDSIAWEYAEFHTAIREGKTPNKELQPMMPRFADSMISEADLKNIHAFIQTKF